jgi:hypothetical protein
VGARQTPAIEREKFHGVTLPGACTALSAPKIDCWRPEAISKRTLDCAFESRDVRPLPLFDVPISGSERVPDFLQGVQE